MRPEAATERSKQLALGLALALETERALSAMQDPRTDQIAREAARLVETGRADSIGPAIRAETGHASLRSSNLPQATPPERLLVGRSRWS